MTCLYCGKKRGLAFFKKDGFCSAEHRQLWQEREASNLVQRLNEARDGRELEPLRLPQPRFIGPAAAELPAGETVKQLGDGTATPASEVGIVISRQAYVAPVTETPKPAPPAPKPANFLPPESIEPQTSVVRKVKVLRTVDQQPEAPHISSEEVRKPAPPSDVPAETSAEETKAGRCLYCGKKRGLALFKRDDFCSAEHRRLWESANLVQRLIEAQVGGKREPLRLPKRPSTDSLLGDTSPSAVLRELQASIGQHATNPSEETVSSPPAVEPVTGTSPVEQPDPIFAGFVAPSSIQLEHQEGRAVWTADAPLAGPECTIFLPASAIASTGFAGSQTGVPIHACDAGPVTSADKRLNASWPGRGPLDTAFLVESRKPGLSNCFETPISIQALTLDQTALAGIVHRNRHRSGSILSRMRDVTTSSRTPELILATGTVTPGFLDPTHSAAAMDMALAGVWPVRKLALPIGSGHNGLANTKFVSLPTQPLSAYGRVGASARLSQSFRPSILSRTFEPQLLTGNYSTLRSSFNAPGTSIFLAVPAVAGREVSVGIDPRSRPALSGSCFTSVPFLRPASVPYRPAVSAVATLFSLAIPSRAAEHKLTIARFTVGTLPKLALQPSSVSPTVTLKVPQEIARLRPTLARPAFVNLPAEKPAAVEVTRGADTRGGKNAWTDSLRTMFRRPRVDPSASPSKQGGDRVSKLSGGLSGLETPERVWAKSLLLPVSRRADLARHVATPSKLVLSALGAGRTETSEGRQRPDLKRRAWLSSPLLIERRKHALPAIIDAFDLQLDGVALNSKAVAPQPNSPCERTPFSQFQPLVLAPRAIEPQLASVSHAQASSELDLQSDPQTAVVLSVKAPPAYTPQIERTGQGRRNAPFVPIVLEQQLETISVGMTASVSRLRLPVLSGRGLEPTLTVATFEQYPEALNVANLQDAGGHSIGTSRSANPAVDSVRQGLANPGFLPFDIEQPLMQEQRQATLALRPAPNLTYIPLRDSDKQVSFAAAAETWCDPIELGDFSPLILESFLQPSATNSTLPSLRVLGPSDTSSSVTFKHLQVAAATSPWHDASPWSVPKVRLHEPLISLRGPSCRSLISSDSRSSRNDTSFRLAPFSYCEFSAGPVKHWRPELATDNVPGDFARDSDVEMLEMALANDSAEFEPTETVEDYRIAGGSGAIIARPFRRCLAGTVRPDVLLGSAQLPPVVKAERYEHERLGIRSFPPAASQRYCSE